MRRLLEFLLGCVAPPRCIGCDTIGVGGVCLQCGALEPATDSKIDGVPVVAAGRYTGALAAAIRRFKYESRADLARPLADLLVPSARELAHPSVAWVPVPLHPKRLAERGFNQSALLARHLARQTRTGFAPRLLFRTRDTEHQARLDRRERLSNVESVFGCRGGGPRRVVLVDDVVTSGATAAACMAALASSGSTVEAVFALARAGRDADAPPSKPGRGTGPG